MPAVGVTVVDDDGGRGEQAEGGVGLPGAVRGEEGADRGGELRGLDGGVGGHGSTVRRLAEGGSSTGPSPRGRVHTAGMLAIGEFSRLTHLSIRTLRRYHDAELLVPADGGPGDRLPPLQRRPDPHRPGDPPPPRARRTPPEVRRILRTSDPGTRAELVADHLRRLEAELDRTRAAVTSLRRLLAPEPAPVRVEVRTVAAATVAAVEDDVELDDVLGWYAGAMAELDAALDASAGVPGGVYDNALFEVGRGHVLVHRSTDAPPSRGRVRPVTLPAVELAVATHVGPHDDIDVTYGEVGAWVVANALAVAGPIRETYLVGPRDTADSSAWRTEIGWPVFRVAAT